MAELHVRNLPADLHDRLRARAAAEGRSMSAEVVAILRQALDGPAGSGRSDAITKLRRLQARRHLAADQPAAEDLVRADRDAAR